MNLEAILAVDINNGLSKNGSLAWNSKTDMIFFKEKTLNNIVIMGKNTYFSIPEKHRPLHNRLNIVLTNDINLINSNINNILFTNSINIIDDISSNIDYYREKYSYLKKDFKIFIIGGKNIYEQFLNLCNKIWITTFKKSYNCDLFLDYNFNNYFENIILDNNELSIKEYYK